MQLYCVTIQPLPVNANFSTEYFLMYKINIDEGGIKQLHHGCLPV